MRSKRTVQIVVGVIGTMYLALSYPLATDLWRAKWLLVMKNETEPMFLSFYIALGVFLVLAARKPFAHRLLILFAAWQSIAHGLVMGFETVQAWQHGVHRDFMDVVLMLVIGGVLLAIAPRQHEVAVAMPNALDSSAVLPPAVRPVEV